MGPKQLKQSKTSYVELYNVLLTHYCHQNNLYWGSASFLIALQGGVFTAGYSLRHSWLGMAIFFFGAILGCRLLDLIKKYELDRDVNKNLMEELGERIVPFSLKQRFKNVQLRDGNGKIKGSDIMIFVNKFFIFVDGLSAGILLVELYLYKPLSLIVNT